TVNKNAAELKQSKVHMGLMKTEFDRTSALYAKNAASKANFDSAESNYKAAQQAVSAAASALRQSQIDLNWTSVRAPISGYSGRENYSVGNLVEAGSLMTSVVHSKQIYVDFAIPADIYRKYLKMTDKGQLKLKPEGVTVTLELGDGTKIDKKGKIDFQNQFVTPESASIKTRAIFENDGNSLYSGQFVRVFLNGYYIPKFIEIPLQSVLQVNDKYYVYRLNEEDIPEVVEVKLLMMIANSFVLESGLKDGERIIVDGIGKVQAGKKVKVEAK
ncbi:MAG: efflux RND transporter periplasmic adaptor subunit, partial [Synergistes sp.]|nr:efflux RND transporter periplasmic adaptor subunit [Synergistes sp.]